MDFHGKGETMYIREDFPEDIKENEIYTLHYPSIYNKLENGMFVGVSESMVIIPPFEYQIPKEDLFSDFVMAKTEKVEQGASAEGASAEGASAEGGLVERFENINLEPKYKYYKPTKENMPPSTEITNEYGFKLYKFKGEDGRNKYFCDNFQLTKEEAIKKWKKGFPVVVFAEGNVEKPKTFFPVKVGENPNLFLVVLANISNMDFEQIEKMEIEGIENVLTANGLKHYNNLRELALLLREKPGFLRRKYNGIDIFNKKNLRLLLVTSPPNRGKFVSKWRALNTVTKMIRAHEDHL